MEFGTSAIGKILHLSQTGIYGCALVDFTLGGYILARFLRVKASLLIAKICATLLARQLLPATQGDFGE